MNGLQSQMELRSFTSTLTIRKENTFWKDMELNGSLTFTKRMIRFLFTILSRLQKFPHICMLSVQALIEYLRIMIQWLCLNASFADSHFKRTLGTKWHLISQRQLSLSTRKTSAKDIHSQKLIMFFARTINMVPWKMLVVLLTQTQSCVGKNPVKKFFSGCVMS